MNNKKKISSLILLLCMMVNTVTQVKNWMYHYSLYDSPYNAHVEKSAIGISPHYYSSHTTEEIYLIHSNAIKFMLLDVGMITIIMILAVLFDRIKIYKVLCKFISRVLYWTIILMGVYTTIMVVVMYLLEPFQRKMNISMYKSLPVQEIIRSHIIMYHKHVFFYCISFSMVLIVMIVLYILYYAWNYFDNMKITANERIHSHDTSQ